MEPEQEDTSTTPSTTSSANESAFTTELKKILESLIVASPNPLRLKEIQDVLKNAEQSAGDEDALRAARFAAATGTQINSLLTELGQEYERDERGFRLVEGASGWHIITLSALSLWVRQLFPELRPTRLTPASLETLAIIAYRQPLTRADLEAVRGVSCDGPMQTLLDRGLVKIAGRAEQPGRPLLYETTTHFLEHFGLRNLDELPNAAELGDLLQKTQEQQEKIRETNRREKEVADQQAESEETATEQTPEEAAAAALQEKEEEQSQAVEEPTATEPDEHTADDEK